MNEKKLNITNLGMTARTKACIILVEKSKDKGYGTDNEIIRTKSGTDRPD